MADIIVNVGKGRFAEFYYRVKNNDPANSAIVVGALKTSGLEADSVLKDYANLDAMLKRGGASQVAEVGNSGYARKVLTDADLAALTVDNTNDRMPIDFGDQTFAAIAAGDGWSKLFFAYDSDTTAGTDANIIVFAVHDFVVTPDGTDITATINDEARAS